VKIHLPAFGPDLPVHGFTGLTAIGLRRNGDPIWPVRGGAPDDDDTDGDDAGDDDTADGSDADDDEGSADDKPDLGDAGKKAIDRMKGQLKQSRSNLRPWTALATEFGAKTPDELRNLLKGKKPDGGDAVDPDQIRREARAEADREVARERLLDKIEAKAARFADPADAATILLKENDADDFLDGTKVDADAIAEALEELLERKPYLAGKRTPTSGAGKAPKPDRSQGSRGGDKPSAADRAAKRLERMGLRQPSNT
jgi:hypothetical protein